MELWSDRGSTCKFRNARSAFRNLHMDPLSLHTSMRNKQVEFNPYIYTLSKLYRLATKYPFFNTKHPAIILRASLFVVTPSYVASSKIEYQNFSYVYRSRKHWKCKYYVLKDIHCITKGHLIQPRKGDCNRHLYESYHVSTVETE